MDNPGVLAIAASHGMRTYLRIVSAEVCVQKALVAPHTSLGMRQSPVTKFNRRRIRTLSLCWSTAPKQGDDPDLNRPALEGASGRVELDRADRAL
jgi:hypothetical protein